MEESGIASKKEEILLDSEKLKVREVSGTSVGTIPKRWIRRSDLKSFFEGDLDIKLILDAGEVKLEIVRRKTENGVKKS